MTRRIKIEDLCDYEDAEEHLASYSIRFSRGTDEVFVFDICEEHEAMVTVFDMVNDARSSNNELAELPTNPKRARHAIYVDCPKCGKSISLGTGMTRHLSLTHGIDKEEASAYSVKARKELR